MSAESPLRDREFSGFDLIETLRWEPDAGFIRLDRHLARLGASAAKLGFTHDPERITTAIADAIGNSEAALRVRLVLSPDGTVNASAHPHATLPADTIWRLRLAREKLDSADPLLRHKTSRRETYVQARAEYPATEVDEVLLANERDETCEGTITTFFADFGGGILLTPKLECGLLAGVLRAELLDQGQAREAVLFPADLRAAKALFVGNSLRGLISARLA